jgi:hypothetical protein
MRLAPALATFGLIAALGLSACSEKAQDAAQNTGDVIADDVSNAATDMSNAADRFGERAEGVFNDASREADNAADATGAALENAGRDLKD